MPAYLWRAFLDTCCIAYHLSSNDSGSTAASCWAEEADGALGIVVPAVKLDTSSWNLAEISPRFWNTVVSLPLASFLVRCKATLIMHLPIMESPSGPWPLPFGIPDNWSQWLAKKFSASSTLALFWLDLSLSTSCLPKHLPMPSWHLVALSWQLRMLALSHGKVVDFCLKSMYATWENISSPMQMEAPKHFPGICTFGEK